MAVCKEQVGGLPNVTPNHGVGNRTRASSLGLDESGLACTFSFPEVDFYRHFT